MHYTIVLLLNTTTLAICKDGSNVCRFEEALIELEDYLVTIIDSKGQSFHISPTNISSIHITPKET